MGNESIVEYNRLDARVEKLEEQMDREFEAHGKSAKFFRLQDELDKVLDRMTEIDGSKFAS